jgi:hypothetical protein
VTDLIYPAFPRRPFVVGGLVVLALIAAAVMVNLHGPNAGRCAASAKHEIASQGRVSAHWLRTCGGLSTRQITKALEIAYRAEYGRYLRGTPMIADLPPSSYRSASARAALRQLAAASSRAGTTGGHG